MKLDVMRERGLRFESVRFEAPGMGALTFWGNEEMTVFTISEIDQLLKAGRRRKEGDAVAEGAPNLTHGGTC